MDIDGSMIEYVQIDDRQLAEVVQDNYKPEDIFDANDLKFYVGTMFSPEEVFPRGVLMKWAEDQKGNDVRPETPLRVKQREKLMEIFLSKGGRRVSGGYDTENGFFADEMFSRCGRNPTEQWTWADEWLEEVED